jgi:hypothetical protein
MFYFTQQQFERAPSFRRRGRPACIIGQQEAGRRRGLQDQSRRQHPAPGAQFGASDETALKLWL